MRIMVPMMILIMMTSTLAGCTGGDPDGGGNDEINMDVLNSLIDDNLQDFINNTTITCLLYTSPSPRDGLLSRMPSSA